MSPAAAGKAGRREAPGAVECLEEALALLRALPPRLAASYALGSIPFLLALVHFWADMSRSAAAPARLPGASLQLALLFVWMKVWHAVFATGLRARLAGGPAPAWTPRRIGRLVALQATAQATGLVLLPLASLFALPFGWVFAFYQNLSAVGDGREGWRSTVDKAWRLALLWPAQNHRLLGIVSIFWSFVALNIAVALASAPGLVQTLTGTQVVAGGPGLLLNTTFLVVVLALSWLCVDPLVKTAYVLRCFSGAALQTGEDLRAEIRAFSRVGGALAAALVASLLLFSAPAGAGVRAPIAPEVIDRAVAETAAREEFAWRMPRERAEPREEQGVVAEFIRGALAYVVEGLQAAGRWLGKIRDWFAKLFPKREAKETPERQWIVDIMAWRQGLLLLACAAVASVAGVWAWRRHQRRRGAPTATAPVVAGAPDLTQADVAPDRLPADGWIALARELAARGEWRLCLRALYLAGLADLGRRDLLRLAPWKSNRDYERELQRTAAGGRELTEAFATMVTQFERVWFGRHTADERAARDFTQQLGRIVPGAGI